MDDYPTTEEKMLERIHTTLDEVHDYSSAAEALVECALAAFNYACYKVGATGLQASGAAFKFLAKANCVDGPMVYFKADDLLYPQYDLEGKFLDWMHSEEVKIWLSEVARQKLAQTDQQNVHPDVWAHWESLLICNSCSGTGTHQVFNNEIQCSGFLYD